MSINQILQESMKTIAMESEEPVEAGDLDTLNEALDDIDENKEAEMELAACESALEITESTIAGLESLAVVVEGYKENGGMDATTASLLNASITSIMAPFGGTASKPLPSLESYEGDGGRVTATTFALEGIRETIGNMWKAFTNMISKAQAAVLKWITTNNMTIKRMAKAAATMAEKAKTHNGVPKVKSLPVRRAEMLVTDNKVIGLTPAGITALGSGVIGSVNEDLISGAIEYSNMIGGLSLTDDSAVDKATAAIGRVRSDINKNGTALDPAQIKAKLSLWSYVPGAMLLSTVRTVKSSTEGYDDDKFVIYHNKAIPGNYTALFKIPGNINRAPEKLSLNRVRLSGKEADKYSFDAFTASELATFCEAIASTGNKLASESKSKSEIDKMFNSSRKAANSINKAANKSDDASAALKTVINHATSNIKSLNFASRSTLVESRKHAANVLFAAYGFAKDSYVNLKAESAPAGEGDAA